MSTINTKRLFTSESVTEGHPDKICDIVADSILDAYLTLDPFARVACEVAVTTDYMLIFGEVTSVAEVNVEKIARQAIIDIGYDRAGLGFDGNTCRIDCRLHRQSADIARGVDGVDDRLGAGDQGLMFGYACTETPELMPLPIMLAHGLTRQLAVARHSGQLAYLRPDGKSQVTVEYQDDRPVRIDAIVLSTQHEDGISRAQIERDLMSVVVPRVIDMSMIDSRTRIFVNPTGNFVIGGPHGDSGLTGRKIIVDTYGGYCPHGGGSFSGKDCTKVDRSAAYMARYVCKNIVARGLADRIEMQVSYAIGVSEPVSISVFSDTVNGRRACPELAALIQREYDLSPSGIIRTLGLRRPQYRQTASYGHFGRPEFAWELDAGDIDQQAQH